MYSFAKIIVIVMISFSNGFLFPSQFKYHNKPKSVVNNHSSLIPIETYKRKNNPNEYGNLVAYASPIKRSRTPTMLIDEGLGPFRNAFDYVLWACVIISVFIRPPPPPPPPPMTPLLVEKPNAAPIAWAHWIAPASWIAWAHWSGMLAFCAYALLWPFQPNSDMI